MFMKIVYKVLSKNLKGPIAKRGSRTKDQHSRGWAYQGGGWGGGGGGVGGKGQLW